MNIQYHVDGMLPVKKEDWIFVFGSNLEGRHGLGAAKVAHKVFGAELGVGKGFCGRSYAIPTKDHNLCVLSIRDIEIFMREYILFLTQNENLKFWMTSIGCGLAGYKPRHIAQIFFKNLIECNTTISLPDTWSLNDKGSD